MKPHIQEQKNTSVCQACGSERRIYARGICAACYSGWMRQRRKFRGRAETICLTKTVNPMAIVHKFYGKNFFCHECGKRPVGMDIIFMDNNKQNKDVENLKPVCSACQKELIPSA